MPLTDLRCRNAEPKDKQYKLFDARGLHLLVATNGSKFWRYKYRYLGKEKTLSLGAYPEVSLKEARERHFAAHKLVSDGRDPSLEKQEVRRRQIANAQNTFEGVAYEWLEHNKELWSENHAKTIQRRLERDVLPLIGHKPIRDISPRQLLDVIKLIEKRSAYEMARRALQMAGQIFRYAIIHDRADRDPSQDLKGALRPYKKSHYAAMDIKELPEFLSRLDRNVARVFPVTQIAIEMLMLTFVRTGELIKAQWSEIDFEEEVWIIPAARMKMRKDHVVPLSNQVLALLERLKEYRYNSPYLFPSQRTWKKHMSNNAILVALDRMGYRGQHTGHGFRALAMSAIKEKLGYRHEVIDRQLAHSHRNQVTAAYDRAQFLDERKVMMQDWADFIDKLRGKNESKR
jgi:integrase